MALQGLGVEVIALDRYDNTPAMQVAHRSYVLSMLDGKELRRIIELEKPCLIVPGIFSYSFEYLRIKFKIFHRYVRFWRFTGNQFTIFI